MLTKPTLQCVVPARNEAGHLEELIASILTVQEIDFVVIVEGGSTDDTFEIASNLSKQSQGRVVCLKQTKKGKFNAVLEGSISNPADFTMVWDADGTVPVESTRLIISQALETHCLSMGDRLRGKIEPGAMQFANNIGNWLFAIAWAPINKIRPTDIFCGTKIAPTEVFTSIPQELIDRDPYGDISILISARILNIKVKAIPVRYTARVYGESNMRRWRTGFIFLRLTIMGYLLLFSNHIKRKIS